MEKREGSFGKPTLVPTTNVFWVERPGDDGLIRRFAVGSFKKSWKTACHKAGLPCTVAPVKKGGKKGSVTVLRTTMLFHDLRRSAAREFQRQGFTEGQIMRMCGWETRSVFDRYAIVTNEDIRQQMNRINGAANGAAEGAGTHETQ
jgi:hypothetical protein